MTDILIDSSVIIDYLRQKDKNHTTLFKLASPSDHTLYVSLITYVEIYSGKSVWEREEVKAAIKDLFLGMTVLPINTDIAEQAGAIRAKSHSSIADSLIAATAIDRNMKIATLDTNDFAGIDTVELFPLAVRAQTQDAA